jgi:hypothetical protein
MKFIHLIIVILIIALYQTSCKTDERMADAQPNENNTKDCLCASPLYREIMVEGLCKRINEIKHLPHKRGEVDFHDPVFNEIIRYGEYMLPCLVEKITDTNIMDSPVRCIGPFKVAEGDVSSFLMKLRTFKSKQCFPSKYKTILNHKE